MSGSSPIAPLRLALALPVAVAAPSPVYARARTPHGHRRHAAWRGATGESSRTERQTVNDEHADASSEQIDRVLDSKIGNICRGC